MVKEQIEMWFFVVCTLIDNEYTSLFFPKHFSNGFCILIQASLQKFLKEKSDAYKQLICIMQPVHFQIRVSVFNRQDKDFVFFDIVVKNKSNVV